MSDEVSFILSEDYTELRISILKQYRDALNEMLNRPIDEDVAREKDEEE